MLFLQVFLFNSGVKNVLSGHSFGNNFISSNINFCVRVFEKVDIERLIFLSFRI